MWSVTLAVLALTPWTIETSEVLPPGFELTQVQSLSAHHFAMLAQLKDDDSTWALFTMEVGQTPQLVQLFHDLPRLQHPEGASVMVVVGEAPSSLYRLSDQGLKHAGTFDFSIDDAACTPDVRQCVLTTENEVRAVGQVARVLGETEVSGVSLSPSGRVVALDMPDGLGGVVIRSLDPAVQQTVAVFETRSRRFASPEAVRAPDDDFKCPLHAERWLDDSVLQVGPRPMGEVDCTTPSFRIDRRTLARSPVPASVYPWTVLDCPRGGWQSAAGRLTMACRSAIQLALPKQGRGDEPPALPEAIALSPEAVFIDTRAPVTLLFERGRLKRSFVLERPSVVTMTATGVVVQPLAWPGGVISESFDDGWHLIKDREQPLLVHLFQRD